MLLLKEEKQVRFLVVTRRAGIGLRKPLRVSRTWEAFRTALLQALSVWTA